MPELAEVALFARDLNVLVQDQKVLKVSFPNQNDWGATIIPLTFRKILKDLVGKRISFHSGGKALHLYSGKGETPLLEFRLGMTGQFQLSQTPGKWQRHYFLRIQFKDQAIYYADPRRFGRIGAPQSLNNILGGFDPKRGFWINPKTVVTEGYLKKPKITWLLAAGDQTGVGNYMANEALGRLNLSPFSPCRDRAEALKILKMCRKVAADSYHQGGNSFGSGYFRLNGEEGQYSRFCRFYQNPKIPRQLFRGRPVFSKFTSSVPTA